MSGSGAVYGKATVDLTGATGGEDGGGSAATERGVVELQSGTRNHLCPSSFYMIQP